MSNTPSEFLFDVGAPIAEVRDAAPGLRDTMRAQPKPATRYLVVAWWRGGWWRCFTSYRRGCNWELDTVAQAKAAALNLPAGWSHARIYKVEIPVDE